MQWKLPGIYEGDPQQGFLIMEYMESEIPFFCNHARFSVFRLGHQPNHKTFDLKFFLPVGCAGAMVTQNLLEWPTNNFFKLRHTPGKGARI